MASKNIAFSSIPSSIRKPGKYFEFNTALAVRTLPGNLQKTLIMGQRTAAGTVLANVLTDVFSDTDAATYFGYGSMLHLMVRAALRANPYLALSVIALDDDAASLAAASTVTVTGTASTAGVVTLGIGAQQVQIAVNSGDLPATIASALATQIGKQPDLPVTATVLAGVVTLTAKNKGALGNSIKISVTSTVGTTTVVATAFAGGATDPQLTTVLPTVFSAGHNILVSPYNDATNLTSLRTHLDSVAGPMEQRGAIGVCGFVSTLSTATTAALANNSGRISGILVPNASDLVCEVAASYGAVCASEEDPARPLNTVPLTGLTPPPMANWLSRTEQENALYNGITPAEVGPGGVVQIVRAITMYTVNASGIPDISLLDLTTIRTLDYVRKAARERIALRFPREKLSERTAPKVRSELLDVLTKLEELEIVENVAANAAGLLVERDLQDPNRLDAKIPADVVNGLHVFAGRIDLLL
ncbi:phage tail protein [Sulfuriferula sp. AH1]|uniref:phage tail sheath subtilisin-like domain-containing protein n=1 Tax=Sulfuriferula sp. AH1 TaxID=1985873 RepID=UPI000B3B50F4|nr:phage tail sheath subtilisin-like domain-containing protein [Sulfuriferula sp. AH1]ARU30899.1 phage tail protein [Sulfuriferula sp. AH1]